MACAIPSFGGKTREIVVRYKNLLKIGTDLQRRCEVGRLRVMRGDERIQDGMFSCIVGAAGASESSLAGGSQADGHGVCGS